MNAKYPLTPEGVKRKQEQLFKLPDEKLEEVTIEIAKDLRAWVFENFELTKEQKEYYEKMPQGFNLSLGWQATSAMIGRQFVEFGEVPSHFTSEQKRKRNTKTTISLDGGYSESQGWHVSGGVKISF